MKRLLAWILVFSLVAVLAACNAPAQKEKGEPKEGSADGSSFSAEETLKGFKGFRIPDGKVGAVKDFDKTATISESVIYEGNDICITALSLTYDSYEAALNLLIENRSQDTFSFLSGAAGYNCNSINGVNVGGGWVNCDIPGGESAEVEATFSYSELARAGLYEIADIVIGFSISKGYDELFVTGPLKLQTSLFEEYDYGVSAFQKGIQDGSYSYTLLEFNKDKIYDVGGVSILSYALVIDGRDDYQLLLEVENTSSDTRLISLGRTHINGIMVYTGCLDSYRMNPGNSCVGVFNISNKISTEEAAIYGISTLSQLGLTVNLENERGADISQPVEIWLEFDAKHTLNSAGKSLFKDDQTQILWKGAVQEDGEYSKDIVLYLLLKNTDSQPVEFRVASDCLQVNGESIENYYRHYSVSSGKMAIMTVTLQEEEMERIGVAQLSDISEIVIPVTFWVNGDQVGETVVEILNED